MRLEPPWIGELLVMWAARDWADAQRELGYPSVSPMFSRAVGSSASEDVTEFSSAEMRAIVAAVEWLQCEHPQHWRALSREYRSWTRATLQAGDDDERLVIEAGALLAARVDALLE